jgi:sugar/nucleoside kinase (ribokinase family)
MTASSPPTLDLLCIGNAIVDVLATVDDALLADIGSPRGGMTLIDAGTASTIEARVTPQEIMGGGSAANTAVTAARMGLSVGYLGKVADDAAGRHFADDLRALGLRFPSNALPSSAGIPTARCIVLVTPDGQRTMHTYLGACVEFGPDDVLEEVVASAGVLYMEGYLYDRPEAQAAFERAARLAHQHGRKVALSLSDSFCVNRHRAAFRALVAGHVDILFANEAEILALYQTDDFAAAAASIAAETELAALTRGEHGCVVVAGGKMSAVLTEPAVVVDSTGAGDAFAAGFLAALARGAAPREAGALGNRAAGSVIGRLGARPGADFALRV